ncbi:MAG: hypothetical protein Q7S21_04405 [archaeon]|nr:hypothetical protein [archaeon]
MGFYFGTIKDSIKKSFTASYLLNTILLLIISLLLFAVAFLIVLIPAILSIMAFQFSIAGIFVLLLLLILFIVLMALVGAITSGIGYNLGKQHWNASNVSLSNAWNDSKPRIMTLFKVDVVVCLIALVVMLIAFLPAILSIINVATDLIAKYSATGSMDESLFADAIFSLLAIVGTFLLGLLLLIILFLIFLPFFYLYRQVALFENGNTPGSIKKSLHYMKKNYGLNWIMIFLFAIIIFLIFIPVVLIQVALGPLGFIINWIFTIWATAVSYLFSYRLYAINAERQ